jgi:predicted ester cyclase
METPGVGESSRKRSLKIGGISSKQSGDDTCNQEYGRVPNQMTPSKHAEELATAFLTRVWNGTANDLSAIDELMTEDYQIHSAMKTVRGREAFRQWVSDFQAVLKSARNDMLEVFANAAGDRVVARWMCSGLNNGMFGTPADGRPVKFSGIAIWRVEHGRLAEGWIERAGLEAYKNLTSPDDT